MGESPVEPFVTTEQVAEFLGKPVSWVYNNAARLDIPRYRLANQLRWRLSEVSEWAERKAVNGR